MSTAHLSLDDYAFPGPKPHSSYELSYALDAHHSSSLYPHAGLDASSSNPHRDSSAHFQHLPPDAPHHSMYLPDHPENFLAQYYGLGYPNYDAHLPPYAMAQRPPSPRTLYTANPGWGAPEGYGAPVGPTASSSTFLHNLQNVIDSSHTSQVQQQQQHQQHEHSAQVAQQQSVGPSSSSWTLSGSLDPATGVFQRSVEHPRLRTAQACEKCRVRKAKCSGEHPACQRCMSRGLQCEYAPERKMRGPNKQKRKSVSQRHESSPSGDRRSSIASISSTMSSSSDASVYDANAAAAAAATASVNRSATRPSSRSSAQASVPSSPEGSRPRSTTIALGAIHRAAEYVPSPLQRGTGSPPLRQRPPPLDLSDARQFSARYPTMLAQYTRGGEPIGAYGSAAGAGLRGEEVPDARRPSLPPYLVEAYSRIASSHHGAPPQDAAAYHESFAFVAPPTSFAESSDMARSDALDSYMYPATSSPHDLSAFLQSSPTDALSVYSNPRSNSSDVSAPITPLSLSDSGSMFDGVPPELAYPAFESAFTHAASAEPEAAEAAPGFSEHSYLADGMQTYGDMEDAFRPKSAPESLGANWEVSMDDETPRADNERKLSHVGRLMADAVLA
ncbi:hypothetical protein TRAPUB_5966 [Trametes pubescens]|uniref:Zn(2)-C6 fungal-type domain-containing protein n=1 Tax=Trametes pubescens TaxID=154538 RepID=A0A1M2W708_TRAPU|nr:hypothetical protein TRAPUB_5966 [Trametes pubescens]